MARIIECVPNCSEGRDKEIIEYIADAVRSVPGVALMDYSSDENHNRSVYTIVGDPDQMGEAAFRFAKACVEKIDMTKHHGEHPRMGAVDVIPFTPVKDVSMEECIELSKKVAQRISAHASHWLPSTSTSPPPTSRLQTRLQRPSVSPPAV